MTVHHYLQGSKGEPGSTGLTITEIEGTDVKVKIVELKVTILMLWDEMIEYGCHRGCGGCRHCRGRHGDDGDDDIAADDHDDLSLYHHLMIKVII